MDGQVGRESAKVEHLKMVQGVIAHNMASNGVWFASFYGATPGQTC